MERISPLRHAVAIAIIGLSAALLGCRSTSSDASPPRPAMLNHSVFFTLVDPDDARELIRDCDEWIASIPGVRSYYCGTPFDSGRESVDASYDIGLYVGFDSPEDYAVYVEHPIHIRLVEKWSPRLRVLLVRDVIDATR